MSKKNLFAFITSFILLITVIVLNRLSFNEMSNYSQRVDHTRQVITAFENISNYFKSAQIYTPFYSGAAEEKFYATYKSDADSINEKLTGLAKLVNDNPEQKKRVDSLTAMMHTEMDVLLKKNVEELILSGESSHLDKILAIHAIIKRGIAHEESLLVLRTKKLSSFTHLTNLLTVVFEVIAIAIFLFTFLSNLLMAKQHKWLEGFLESILNTSQNGVVHYKAIREKGRIIDFRIEFVNNAIANLLGVHLAEVLGKKLSELPSFILEADLINKYIQVVETGTASEFEIFYDQNKNKRWFLVSLVKLNDGITASFHDISQLKNSEENLRTNIKELKRSNVELEQYAYAASHDLQEPLRKIRSFGSYLQDTQENKLDEKGRQHLSKIMSSAERMSMLIKDILAFSSLKKERMFVVTDLNKILNAVVQDLDLMISQKNAVIAAGHLPTIEAIPLQMNQLFYNLINNSLKFSKDNEQLHIAISSKKLKATEVPAGLQKNKVYYEIIFSDNGIGFNQDYAEQIFGLFKKLNDRQLYPGSGIGLALCKKVAGNHNGEIIAKGKENEGASFYVYLPEKNG